MLKEHSIFNIIAFGHPVFVKVILIQIVRAITYLIKYILKLLMIISDAEMASKLPEIMQSPIGQPVPPQESITDEYIMIADNDDYHDHILNLLKIKNNPNLNKYYYQFIQKIKKSLLIENDLSVQDENTKKIEQELVPTDILKKCMPAH